MLLTFGFGFSLTQTHLDFKKEPLDSIDNELMQAKTVLVDITEPRRVCLQELGLRKNFVMWVKEALEGKWLTVHMEKKAELPKTTMCIFLSYFYHCTINNCFFHRAVRISMLITLHLITLTPNLLTCSFLDLQSTFKAFKLIK